jgi:hypothetical protein
METVNKNSLTRQRRLQIWILEHAVTVTELASACGISKQSMSQALYKLPTMPAELHAHCLQAGIPEELLAPATRPKAELLRENLELRERVAMLESRLDERSAQAVGAN